MGDVDDAVLVFVRTFVDERGFSPSIREIVAGVGVRSTQTVAAALNRLSTAGMVAWEPGRPRTLRVVEPAATEES